MSAVELLAKVNRFLKEQTVPDERVRENAFDLVWQSSPQDSITSVIDEIRSVLSPPSHVFERAEPSEETLTFARVFGKPWNGPDGAVIHRFEWKLSDEEMHVVAQWLDRHEGALKKAFATPFVHKSNTFYWPAHFQKTYHALPNPELFIAVLSRPRHIANKWNFYDVDHYRQIKTYMADIALAQLIDKSVLPKGSLTASGVEPNGE